MLRVDQINFGSEDARNLSLRSEKEKAAFLKSFVLPRAFRIEEFYSGDRYFVHGPKGGGKTALLQYIRLRAEAELGAITSFYYFQSSFSQSELRGFNQNRLQSENEPLNDTILIDPDQTAVFWRLFLLAETARLLRKADVIEGVGGDYLKLVEAAKAISQSRDVARRYPVFKDFDVQLSRNPSIRLSGEFTEASSADLVAYLELAEDALEDVYLDQTPIFLFVDEMEVYLRGDDSDANRFMAIASLVRAIRNFNERFADSDIRVIAAVRDEVVDQVDLSQGEVHRIVRDKGVGLEWQSAVQSDFHPLERMVLRRIATQDEQFAIDGDEIPDEVLSQVFRAYFPRDYALRNCLNLTWYRPRDLTLLFDEASKIDAGHNKFRADTLKRRVVRALGTRLWQDAISGLAIRYRQRELKGIERILRGGRATYTRSDLINRINDLRDMYDDVAEVDETGMHKMLENLYRTGVIYTESLVTHHKNFYFRSDPMPSFSSDFLVGVHQTLRGELSIEES